MKQYLPDYEWFLIDAMMGPVSNDNSGYAEIHPDIRRIFKIDSVRPAPPHTTGQLDPAFADSPLFTLAGFQGGDDAA